MKIALFGFPFNLLRALSRLIQKIVDASENVLEFRGKMPAGTTTHCVSGLRSGQNMVDSFQWIDQISHDISLHDHACKKDRNGHEKHAPGTGVSQLSGPAVGCNHGFPVEFFLAASPLYGHSLWMFAHELMPISDPFCICFRDLH